MTIIVIAHSVRPELERCFDSIRQHAGMPVETILVDNASTDDTVAWTRSEHPEVAVIELPRNLGEAARDEGLRRSESRYTMFLDSDAALTPGALPAMVAALDENPDGGWSARGSSTTTAPAALLPPLPPRAAVAAPPAAGSLVRRRRTSSAIT